MTASLPAKAVKDLALAEGATIKSFLTGVTELAKPKAATRTYPVAKTPQISAAQEAAADDLVDAIRGFKFVDVRRELTADERKDLGGLIEKVKAVKKLIEVTEGQLRIVAFNDFDVVAEREGRVNEDTPRDKDGFYLTKAEGPGYERTVTSASLGTDVDELEAAVGRGELTRREFGSITRTVRVVNEEGYLKLVGRKPHLIDVLRRGITITKRGSVSFKVK